MIKIETHISGEVLNNRSGRLVAEGLEIEVGGRVPATASVSIAVNGVPASISNGKFKASVVLTEPETDLLAVLESPERRFQYCVRVVWAPCPRKRYRFAIDDNIFFLREIARENPKSLFECPYLAGLRDLNHRYGTKFVLNTFYTTPEGDFTLDKFPAKYRREFSDNADWLSLAFHAYSEFPDCPYKIGPREKLADDYDLVANEILRFAGEDAYSPATVIHWGMVPEDNWTVLAERGTRILSGFFRPKKGTAGTGDVKGNAYSVNYCMDNERSAFLSCHDLFKDFRSGLFFSRIDIVCDKTPPEKVEQTLRPLMYSPASSEIMDILTHEQYFWPFYQAYLPDYFARVEAAIRFCSENGYEPVFLHREFDGTTKGK